MEKAIFDGSSLSEISGDVLKAIAFAMNLPERLPNGYIWKQKPQIKKIKKIIEKANKSIKPKASYKMKFETGRDLVHSHLFGNSKKSKQPKLFAVEKRKARQYAKVLEKVEEVPLMNFMGKEAKKKLKLMADIYKSYSDGWLTKELELTQKPIDVDYALKKRIILNLYKYLSGLLHVDHKWDAKAYGERTAKTEGFLIKTIKNILPMSKTLTENQIRQIVLKS